MPILSWLMPRPMTPEHRENEVQRHQWLASVGDTAFRIVEMTLVLGVVRFLETKYHENAVFSNVLSGILLVFIRGKLTSALYAAIDNFGLSEANKRRLAWTFWFLTALVWVGAMIVVGSVLPLIVAHEGD